MYSTITIPYPCDRGDGTKGYHNFILSPGANVPVCTFCGAFPAKN